MSVEFRHFPVGISVEQLAVSWARTKAGPTGSAVMIDHEIGGRQRLGIPWKVPSTQALACALIVHPTILADTEDLLWVVGLVAAARAVPVRAGWPDLLVIPNGSQVGAVGLDVQVDRGAIASAVVSLRLDLGALGISCEERRSIAESFVVEVVRCTDLAKDMCADLLEEYAEVSALIGNRVKATLLPKGDTRGKAAAVDPFGRFVLESPTGMLERLSAMNVLRVDVA
jgi:biotin-(acetyl-CoA carboxylase) ligase